MVPGLKSGLTVCAQPKKLKDSDKTIGYMIARESWKDRSSKLLYCTEAVAALMMQSRLMTAKTAQHKEEITTVIVDEVRNRSAQSDYVLALALAAVQKTPDLAGDHQLVEERIPYCQRLVMRGAMHSIGRHFLTQPMERSHNMLNTMAQIVITYHNERAGKPLTDHTCHSDTAMCQSILPARSWFSFQALLRFTSCVRCLGEPLISAGHGDSSLYYFMVRVLKNAWMQVSPIPRCLLSLPAGKESQHL